MKMFVGKCIIPLVMLWIQGTYPASLSDTEGFDFAHDIANELSKTLKSVLNQYTNYKNITNAYEEFSNDGSFILKLVDGEKINKKFKEKMEKLFNTKADQLHKIKSKAENLKSSYQHMANLKYNYTNVKDIDGNPSLVEHVPTFSNKVMINLSESFVQIPTNVYSKTVEVLNTAKWTVSLDQTFKENFNNHSDPMMLYQFYCDSTGLFRIYPGNENGYEKDKVDFFDCRRRVWYSQTSASPKDVVIILDMSGSMMGKNIAIARRATETLLDTLHENDYFNIISINKTVRYVSCAKYLIQATKENKEIVKKQLLNMPTPTETINISKGVEEAFNILNSGPEHNRTSADCNKVIMVLSDGIEGSYAAENIFKKYNKDKNVRAFAYMIGRNGNRYREALRTMACKNNGAFYSIETYGNIWDTMLEYMNVLSRPIARHNASHINLTPIYLDSSGLGMILTASIGIFHNDAVAGVAGIDIPVSSFKEFVQNEELGIFSHALVVNNNGFVILHPLLNEQTGYLPAPPNVYFEDLVRAIDPINAERLKHSMIDRDTGAEELDVYLPFDDYRRLWHGKVTYYYSPIQGRDFSSAIGISDFDKYQYEVEESLVNRWIERGMEALSAPYFVHNRSHGETIIQITPWRYCNITAEAHKTEPRSIISYPKAHEIYHYIKNVKQVGDIPENCNKGLVKNLLATAGIANTYVNQSWWKILSENDDNIKSMFVFTSGGYSKHLRRNTTRMFERDIYKNSIFKQATLNVNTSVILSTQIGNKGNLNPPNVLMAGISRLSTDKNQKLVSTVSGVEVTSKYINAILENVTTHNDNNKQFDCKQADDFLCAIIDNNAYVVANNKGDKNNGRPLSDVAGHLVEYLTNISVLQRVVLNDTQGECKNTEEKKVASSSNILYTPLRTLSRLLHILCGTTYWLFFEVIATSVSLTEQTQSSEEAAYTSCTRELTLFRFDRAKWNQTSMSLRELKCSKTCIQKFAISPIPDTNLLFLVADIPCKPECETSGIKQVQIRRNDDDFCFAQEKYRRKPQHCYNGTKNEEAFACNGHMAKPAYLLIVAATCLIFWLYNWR